MMTIGDFARAGQVSVRMLRHYDRLGLLTPAHVDEWSGHRSYEPGQLQRLDRIVSLNQIGFTLDEIGPILDEQVPDEVFVARLRERRAALAEQAHLIARRLAEVTRRLHLIENTGNEDPMHTNEFTRKQLPTERLAALRATVATQPEIAGVIGPLFERVATALAAAGYVPTVAVAVYEMSEEGVSLAVGFRHAGGEVAGVELLELPATDGVTTIHLGEMSRIHESWMALDRHIATSGLRYAGPCREVYLNDAGEDQSGWVTELQQPVSEG